MGMFKKKLNIALDFDNTITADPAFWKQFTDLARSHGHKVFCVTLRGRDLESLNEVDGFLELHGFEQMIVWGTALKSKLKTMERLGVHVDIWIDDDPERLVQGL